MSTYNVKLKKYLEISIYVPLSLWLMHYLFYNLEVRNFREISPQ